MLALAASGLNGQQFAFVGYLPIKDDARAARIRELDAWSRRHAQTQIAIETPYRNAALMRALAAAPVADDPPVRGLRAGLARRVGAACSG